MISDGEYLDFRDLIHDLAVRGRRLDPGDAKAYRCPSGLALTCDDMEAEVASPPIPLRPGFAHSLDRWAATGRAELVGLLPHGITIEGYSTHLSAALPDDLADRAARLLSRLFGPALMLVLDRLDSHGVFVRPRPGRLELCGEYAAGLRLRATGSLFAGAVRACAAALTGNPSPPGMPPELAVDVGIAIGRYGLYIDRDLAFGFDFYRVGRQARLPLAAGGTIGAQEYLELSWSAARSALEVDAAEADLVDADLIVAGSHPLGVEAHDDETHDPPAFGGLPLFGGPPLFGESSPFGRVLRPHRGPSFEVTSEVATWAFTVFLLSDRRRQAYVCVPSSHLGRFVRDIEAGRLDGVLASELDSPPSGRVLATFAQTREPGVWDDLGPSIGLLPPERDAGGKVGRVDSKQRHHPRPGKLGRLGKIPSAPRQVASPEPAAGPPPPQRPRPTLLPGEPSRPGPWRSVRIGVALTALVAGLVAALAALAALAGLFGGSPEPSGSANPVTTVLTSTSIRAQTTAPSLSPSSTRSPSATISSTAPPRSTSTVPPTSRLIAPPPTLATNTSAAAPATTVTSQAPATSSTTVADPGLVTVTGSCAFSPAALTRPVGSSVRFHNQAAVTVSIFINAPTTAPDVTQVVPSNQDSIPYTLTVVGTYFVECGGPGISGGMQITATTA